MLLLQEIDNWVWNTLDAEWMNKLQQLNDFIMKEDLENLTQKTNKNLYIWISVQRREFKKGNINSSRIKLLEKVKGWTWDPSEDKWNRKFRDLKLYISKNKKIPFQRESELGRWVGIQRQSFQGKKLSKNRIKLLETLEYWYWKK